jgi:hypothetical protein
MLPLYKNPATDNQGIPIDMIRARLIRQGKSDALGGDPPWTFPPTRRTLSMSRHITILDLEPFGEAG